jgi:hypothetical protein
MEMNFGTTLIIAAIIGLIPATIASKKGRNFFAWWFFGFALFIVALPSAIIMKREEKDSSEKTEGYSNSSKVIEELANLKAIKDTGAFSEEEYQKREDALKKQLQDPYIDFNPNTKIKLRHNVSGAVSTIRLKEWVGMKQSNTAIDYTPILVVSDKKNGNYLTFTISQWEEIKEKGLRDNYEIQEGSEIS